MIAMPVRPRPQHSLPAKRPCRRCASRSRAPGRVVGDAQAASAARSGSTRWFAQNPDAVYALDLDGRMIAANQACESVSG